MTRILDADRAVVLDERRLEAVASRLRGGAEAFVNFAVRLFESPARAVAARQERLGSALVQAHVPHLPEAYLAATWLLAIVAFLTTLLGLGGLLVATMGPSLPPAFVAGALIVPIMAGATVLVTLLTYPDYRAGERRRQIDRDLPYAVNYIAAMSSAGVIPTTLIRDLAREKTYNEVSREMAWIVRDMDLLGCDLLGALQRGIARSPSRRFQEFLQGAKTTILSGGDLKEYFASKADQYMIENRRIQKDFLESLGLMAESYVTVVIAGPLFMIVMLSIMLVVGRSAESSEMFLFALVFVLLPLAHTGFAWVIKNLTPEG